MRICLLIYCLTILIKANSQCPFALDFTANWEGSSSITLKWQLKPMPQKSTGRIYRRTLDRAKTEPKPIGENFDIRTKKYFNDDSFGLKKASRYEYTLEVVADNIKCTIKDTITAPAIEDDTTELRNNSLTQEPYMRSKIVKPKRLKNMIQLEINSLIDIHNASIDNKKSLSETEYTKFKGLFLNENINIDNLYLPDEHETLTPTIYLDYLQDDINNKIIDNNIVFEILNDKPLLANTDSFRIWGKRVFKKHKLENTQKQKVFRIEFKKIEDDFKISNIKLVKDSDFDGIEDRYDDCRTQTGVSSIEKGQNGCPNITVEKSPKFKWCYPSVLGTAGVATIIIYGIENSKINKEWNGYLNTNNQLDIDQKYGTEQKAYENSQIGIAIGGGAILGAGIWLYCNHRAYKKEKRKFNNALSNEAKTLNNKTQLKLASNQNSIGLVLNF
jgi:hypothetical protein